MSLRLLLVLLLCTASSAARAPDAGRIRLVLQHQQAAWNRGDLGAYMAAGYWQNDSLLFIGKAGPTYGYDSTLARYRRSYPDPAAMGELAFSDVRVQMLAPKAAFVVGRWHLKRTAGDLQGAFTLLFEKKAGRWVIVADHSS